MKKLCARKRPHPNDFAYATLEYLDDIDRICRAFASLNYEVSKYDAYCLWQNYCDGYAASWLILPDLDRQIVQELMPYVKDERKKWFGWFPL